MADTDADPKLPKLVLPKLVYLGAESGLAAAEAACRGRMRVVAADATPESVAAALSDADGLLDASMQVPIRDEMVRAAPRLRIVSCATTGSDHIERGELERRQVPVRTLREDPELLQGLTPAAELSFALLLACARRLPAAVEHVRAGGWAREQFPGVMLRGKCLGLIGCGRIGGWMARYARAFDVAVIGHDPFLDTWPEGIERVELPDLFAGADFLSVHVHLSDETRGLVSRDLLARCKPGAILVNTSRGAIVDEAALLDALESGALGAAGLDVLDGEPDIEHHPLLSYARTHDNLLITPHCGGFSPDAVALVCERAATKVLTHLGLVPE